MSLSQAQIEELQQKYTDQRVRVVGTRPDLERFHGLTGVVKTVNMNGRALVEFDDFHNDIGWYDLRLSDLEILPPSA